MAYRKIYYNEEILDSEDKRIGIELLNHLLLFTECHPITYGELAYNVGYATGHGTLDQHLGNLSEFCAINGMPKISAAVVLSNKGYPGEGFYTYFYGKVTDMEKMAILTEEFAEIERSHYELDKLRAWMKGELYK